MEVPGAGSNFDSVLLGDVIRKRFCRLPLVLSFGIITLLLFLAPLGTLAYPPIATQVTDGQSFVSFMEQFYPAWRSKDWGGIKKAVMSRKDIGADFQTLVTGAIAIAKGGLRDVKADWSKGEFLNAASYADMAFTLVAAKQSVRDPQAAHLSFEQRAAVERLWLTLFVTSMAALGTSEVSPPAKLLVEPHEKLQEANHIAHLLRDATREGLSILGEAWLEDRSGRFAIAEAKKKLAAQILRVSVADLVWPPIFRSGDQVIVVAPEQYERQR